MKKGFIWEGLRFGFWMMIISFIISELINILFSKIIELFYKTQELSSLVAIISNSEVFFGVASIISALFTFVVSIIHLAKYKKKKLAIISLLLSLALIILFLYSYLNFKPN